MRRLAVAALLMAMAMNLHAQKKNEKADTIYVNGNVWTGIPDVQEYKGRKTANPPASSAASTGQGRAAFSYTIDSFAVQNGKFIGVGTSADMLKLKGPHTQVIDLGGKFVMPGFNDAHAHLPGGGFTHMMVDLTGAKSLEEMQQRIAARVAKAAPGTWVVGRGWDHTKWTVQQTPTRQDLDQVTGDHPAIFTRVDGHIAVANTAALKAAGITRDSKAPEGSAIDHDAQGEPTGILREDPAMVLVKLKIPPPTPAQRKEALEYALHEAASWGLTSVQDASEIGSKEENEAAWQDFLTYEELENEGKLPIRITNWLPFDEDLKTLETHRAHHPLTDPMLHTGMLKGYMDGSLGSRTAALLAPYSDDPSNTGLARYSQEKLTKMAVERTAAGFQMGFHAIGDRGAELALNAFEEAERYGREHRMIGVENLHGQLVKVDHADPNGPDLRFRIEHAQVIAPHQVERFAKFGVIASVQPNHLLTDMYWAVSRIGEERATTSYPWKSFEDAGVVLAFGTDYPVEPITPFRGIYAAVTRKSEDGTRSYHTEQKLTIDDALRAYTSGAAFAEFAEREKGVIAPGYLADFVVLDRDLTKVPPEQILGTKVVRTVVGGKTVYEAK